jgi:hypothetical protein
MIVTLDKKQFLLDRILGVQKDDISETLRYQLNASLPDLAMKEIAWNDITSKDTKLPMKKR